MPQRIDFKTLPWEEILKHLYEYYQRLLEDYFRDNEEMLKLFKPIYPTIQYMNEARDFPRTGTHWDYLFEATNGEARNYFVENLNFSEEETRKVEVGFAVNPDPPSFPCSKWYPCPRGCDRVIKGQTIFCKR